MDEYGFEFDFTLEEVQQILPHTQDVEEWYVALRDNLGNYNINTKRRVAAFMAQTAHESAGYTRLRENLNYRAESLIKVWPSRFNKSNAWTYAHQQAAIANKVYADRMGNGGEASGDGWKYKGRGLIQLTGKDNYRACSLEMYGDLRLLGTPEILETDRDAAVKSACWFWNSRNLNSLADISDIKTMTKKINGGYIGLDERLKNYTTAITVFETTEGLSNV